MTEGSVQWTWYPSFGAMADTAQFSGDWEREGKASRSLRSTKPTWTDLVWYFRTTRDMSPELAADHFRQHWPDAVREEDVT